MQTANGLLILSPENQQPLRGVTPAEALILYQMHRVYAQGTPLGDFYIQEGHALTVDQEGRPAEEKYFNQHSGEHVPAKDAVPAKTHRRTNAEEIQRLQRKYVGNITKNGSTKAAFVSTFGDAPNVNLPQTFAEIAEFVGSTAENPIFKAASAAPQDMQTKSRRHTLLALGRADVCAIAVGMKLKVHAADGKEEIITAILEREAALAPKAVEETAPE